MTATRQALFGYNNQMTTGDATEPENPTRARPTGSQPARSQFEPEELRRAIAHYELGIVQSIRPLEIGSSSSPKVVIEAETGRYLLKRRAPGRDDPYAVAQLHRLQLALEADRVPVAELMGTRENNSLLQLGGCVYELTGYIEGRLWAHDERDAHEAGRVLGLVHRSLKRARPAGFEEGSYHAAEHVEHRLLHIVQTWSHGEQDDTLASRVLTMYERAREEARVAGIEREAKQLVHGDWHPGNLVFDHDGRATVVDFDTVRVAQPLTDAASGILQFSMPQGTAEVPTRLDLERLRAFARGYATGSSWPDPDRRALGPLMVESLIAEAAVPIARTGRFGHVEGVRMLGAIERLGGWILGQGVGLLGPDAR